MKNMNNLKTRKQARPGKIISLLLAGLLTFLCSACAVPRIGPPAWSETVTMTVGIQDEGDTITAGISEENPTRSPSELEDLSLMETGGSTAGRRLAALVRCPLPTGVTAENVVSAYLYLKHSGGDEPSLRAGIALKSWVFSDVTWEYLAGAVQPDETAVSVPSGKDVGWDKIEVTGIVRAWLAGEYANYGFVLEETRDGKNTVYYSGSGLDPTAYPKLEVTYTPDHSGQSYGKYSYTAQNNGNCLSFALRDTDGIFYDDLITDTAAFQKVYDEGGESAALSYFKDICLAYIERNKDALQIESIRELSGFDAEIDTAKEYRVALRIGFRDRSVSPGIQVDQDFDYHLRAQLTDGTWAEKTPGESSRIVPGSNAKLDPGKHPWDESFMWGYEKWNDFYTSDVVYFAVTKATDAFTYRSRP